MILGAHESISGSYLRAIKEGLEDGCECIQIFTKNQTQWREPQIDESRCDEFKKERKVAKIKFVLSHTSYLINLASNNKETREKSILSLEMEFIRCQKLAVDYLVMHPGAHMNQGEKKGLELIAEGLEKILEKFGTGKPKLLLETTAGQGSNLGRTFEELAWLLENTKRGDLMGICFDTAHSFSAGYDLKTPHGYEKTFEEFDRIIGIKRIFAFHLNDSKKDLGSRIDRHEHIGKGFLGKETFARLLKDKRFSKLPGILETPPLPNGNRGYKENLDTLKSLTK